jgi:hypothetical protein
VFPLGLAMLFLPLRLLGRSSLDDARSRARCSACSRAAFAIPRATMARKRSWRSGRDVTTCAPLAVMDTRVIQT